MKELFQEIRKQTLTLMVAAFGFVAALVWKDAISAWLKPLYESSEGALGLTIAAFIITVVMVIATMLLTKVLGQSKNSKKKTKQKN